MRRLLRSIVLNLLHLGTSRVPLPIKGVVVVQIDGLGAMILQKAILRGDAPFLASLIKKNRYVLGKYFCPLPTITTAVDAELMYGTCDGIVGYSWFDRTLGQFVRGDHGTQMRAFEIHAFSRVNKPLLKHGSCVIGGWSGGATMANFSAQALADKNPFHRLIKFRVMLVPFLNPIRFLHIMGILLHSALVAIFKGIFKDSMRETLMRIFLSDIGTSVAEIELMRQTPALFINFPIADVLSHKHGLTHPIVFQAIRLADLYCKKIYEASKQSARTYSVVFMADHGQSESIPFTAISGETITELVRKALNDETRSVLYTFGNDKTLKQNMENKTLSIVPSSSIAHMYFSEHFIQPASRETIEKLSPKLIQTLLDHPGIGWVLVRGRDDTQILIGKHGKTIFRKNNIVSETGVSVDGPDRKKILTALGQFATEHNNGDIVLFGALYKDKSVNFEDYQGTHGGFTGHMAWPFIMADHPHLIKLIKRKSSMRELFSAIRAMRG